MCIRKSISKFISEEGRDADRVYKTTIGLDLIALEQFWENAKRRDYSFLTNNCTDAVIQTLKAGNHDFEPVYANVGWGEPESKKNIFKSLSANNISK